jgi:hypothetical protein
VKRSLLLALSGASHLAPYDDQETYFDGLIEFVKKVDADTL